MFQRREHEDKSQGRHSFQFQNKALTKESTTFKRSEQQRHYTIAKRNKLIFKAGILFASKSTFLITIKALRMLMTRANLFLNQSVCVMLHTYWSFIKN